MVVSFRCTIPESSRSERSKAFCISLVITAAERPYELSSAKISVRQSWRADAKENLRSRFGRVPGTRV